MRAFIKNHKFGISLLAAMCLGVLLLYKSGGCLIYRIFHIECLGCGMTRALISALKLDFRAAFHFHPMFWSVPILVAFILFEGRLFKKKIINTIIIGLIVAGFILQYVLKYKGII